jgi:hypothetical protein
MKHSGGELSNARASIIDAVELAHPRLQQIERIECEGKRLLAKIPQGSYSLPETNHHAPLFACARCLLCVCLYVLV